jgi:hypothetical protein
MLAPDSMPLPAIPGEVDRAVSFLRSVSCITATLVEAGDLFSGCAEDEAAGLPGGCGS